MGASTRYLVWAGALAGLVLYVSACDLFTPEGRQPRPIYDAIPDSENGSSAGDASEERPDVSFDPAEGCGEQPGEMEMAEGDAGASDVDSGSDGGGAESTGSTLPEGFEFDSEYEMRFSEFEFTRDSPGAVANSILQQYLDQSLEYPIIVLLHIREVDPQTGLAEVRGGAGVKADKECTPTEQMECEYEWEDETERKYAAVRLHPETGELQGSLEKLDFIGTTKFEDGTIEKFTLPIHEIAFRNAHLRPGDGDEVEIVDGLVQGYVTEEEAEENEVTLSAGSDPIPISQLLNADPLNYDSDDDGEDDSWCLRARFSAIETRIDQD